MMIGLRSRFDLTFICKSGLEYFALPVLRELEKRYKIQIVLWDSLEDLSCIKVRGRTVWCEWLNKGAKVLGNGPLRNKRVFFRLHRFELDRPWIQRLCWRRNFRVVFVNEHFENDFRGKIGRGVETCTIPNAVDCSGIPQVDRPESVAKNICLYSITFEPRKGYREAILLFAELVRRDPDYRFNCMARRPVKETEKLYLASLQELVASLGIDDKVSFRLRDSLDVASDRETVRKFLSENGLFLSFSEHESFQYTMAEAILSGQKAFYRGWVDNPAKQFWKPWSYKSEHEMIDAILAWDNQSPQQQRESLERDRQYVQERFDAPVIARQFEELLFTSPNRRRRSLSERVKAVTNRAAVTQQLDCR